MTARWKQKEIWRQRNQILKSEDWEVMCFLHFRWNFQQIPPEVNGVRLNTRYVSVMYEILLEVHIIYLNVSPWNWDFSNLFDRGKPNWDLVTCWLKSNNGLLNFLLKKCVVSCLFLVLLVMNLLEWYLFWNTWHLYDVVSVILLVLKPISVRLMDVV